MKNYKIPGSHCLKTIEIENGPVELKFGEWTIPGTYIIKLTKNTKIPGNHCLKTIEIEK